MGLLQEGIRLSFYLLKWTRLLSSCLERMRQTNLILNLGMAVSFENVQNLYLLSISVFFFCDTCLGHLNLYAENRK